MKGLRARWRARSDASGPAVAPPHPVDAALASADELIAAGRSVDAIRILTEANRAGRDLRLEQRLVDLRFDAFRQTEWSTTRPDWPDTVEDGAADAAGCSGPFRIV